MRHGVGKTHANMSFYIMLQYLRRNSPNLNYTYMDAEDEALYDHEYSIIIYRNGVAINLTQRLDESIYTSMFRYEKAALSKIHICQLYDWFIMMRVLHDIELRALLETLKEENHGIAVAKKLLAVKLNMMAKEYNWLLAPAEEGVSHIDYSPTHGGYGPSARKVKADKKIEWHTIGDVFGVKWYDLYKAFNIAECLWLEPGQDNSLETGVLNEAMGCLREVLNAEYPEQAEKIKAKKDDKGVFPITTIYCGGRVCSSAETDQMEYFRKLAIEVSQVNNKDKKFAQCLTLSRLKFFCQEKIVQGTDETNAEIALSMDVLTETTASQRAIDSPQHFVWWAYGMAKQFANMPEDGDLEEQSVVIGSEFGQSEGITQASFWKQNTLFSRELAMKNKMKSQRRKEIMSGHK